MQIELEIVAQFLPAAGKSVNDRTREPGAVLPEDRQETCVGVPLVEEHWQAELAGQRKLLLEHRFLYRARREIAVEIEARLADRHHQRIGREIAQRIDTARSRIFGVVRVNAGRRAQ